MTKQLEYHAYDSGGKYVGMVIATPEQFRATEYVAGELPVIDPATLLAQARTAAVDELVVEAERKRLGVLRAAMTVEFANTNSEQAVAEKLAQLKEAR